MNLYTEAKRIAQDAIEESREYGGDASDYIHQYCDGHEMAIYYGKAIQFCADHDTSDGEEWLEGIDSLCKAGDTFGQIACRIAFATLYCAAMDVLAELESEADEWTGSPCPDDPDNYWINDKTGERINANS